jgi:hypothetical protein
LFLVEQTPPAPHVKLAFYRTEYKEDGKRDERRQRGRKAREMKEQRKRI